VCRRSQGRYICFMRDFLQYYFKDEMDIHEHICDKWVKLNDTFEEVCSYPLLLPACLSTPCPLSHILHEPLHGS